MFSEVIKLRKQAISLLEGKTVLEIGCGTGEDMELIKKSGFKVEGIDIFKSSIELCKKMGLKVRLLSIEKLSEKKKYDSVYAWHIVEHLKKDKEAIEKMLRIANKTVIFAVPKMCQHDEHLHYYSEKNIIDLVKDQKCKSYEIIFLSKKITHLPMFIIKMRK